MCHLSDYSYVTLCTWKLWKKVAVGHVLSILDEEAETKSFLEEKVQSAYT